MLRFQFYKSTIITAGHAGHDAQWLISILQKYDYNVVNVDGYVSEEEISILQKYDYNPPAAHHPRARHWISILQKYDYNVWKTSPSSRVS